jgi:kelch motif-containing protein/Kelch motif protein
MFRSPTRPLAFMLSAVVFAACSEDTTPTEPAATGDLSVAEPSHPWLPNHWTRKAPLQVPHPDFGFTGLFGVATGVANNSRGQPILYAFGGTDGQGPGGHGIQAYNLATNTWTVLPGEVNVFNTNGVGKIGGKLYFSGGSSYESGDLLTSRRLWVYDPASNRLTRQADMPKATANGVTGVINGKLYVLPATCSGDFWPDPHYCEQEGFRQLFRYDPVTNAWTTLASAPHFHGSAGGVINGKFYVVGVSRNASTALDVYDPLSNKWKALAPLPAPRLFAVGAVLNGKLWVIGSNGTNRLTYAYNPVTNSWATRASLPLGGANQAAAPITDSQGQGHILVVGGATGGIPAPSELYTP